MKTVITLQQLATSPKEYKVCGLILFTECSLISYKYNFVSLTSFAYKVFETHFCNRKLYWSIS